MFKKLVVRGVGLVSVAVASVSFAEVPAAVGTGLTALQSDALDVINLVWPIVITIVGALILIKLFKRASSKI